MGLKIAGPIGTNVSIIGGTINQNLTITSSSGILTVHVPMDNHLFEDEVVVDTGIRISADNDIRVIATNESVSPGANTSESWAVWATDKLDMEYIIVDASSSISAGTSHSIAIVGTQPKTDVIIRDKAGVEISVTLNAGQAYRYATIGRTVTATKPIAVIAGVECTSDVGAYCDMTAAQMAPIRYWGHDFVVAPGFASNSTTSKANHVVIALKDNTSVTIKDSNGVTRTYTLNARQHEMFETGTTAQLGYLVTADKPIAVFSNLGDPAPRYPAHAVGEKGSAAPTLVSWPPIDGYVESAKMATSGLDDSKYENFLTIITHAPRRLHKSA